MLEPNLDLAILGDHLVGAEVDVGVGDAFAGRDVVLEAMPGTGHDLTLVHPLELPAALGVGDEGAEGRFALAERACLVRADVR